MRLVTCLLYEHNLLLVLLAALMCAVGSMVAIRLFQRTLVETGPSRLHWCFLSSMTTGSTAWATHFIAMLGYRPNVPVTFDGALTVASGVIVFAGVGCGLLLASVRNRALAVIGGGGTMGLSIAAMHYVGMFAYRVDGVVRWIPGYVVASVALSVVLAAAMIARLRTDSGSGRKRWPAALLILSIASLHFVGMAAFSVTPIPGVPASVNSDAFVEMAAAIALAGMLIVGTGTSTHLVDRHTRVASRDQLEYIAMHDALTQLANRRSFTAALERECRRLADFGRPFSLLTVDLDRFKPVNDTLGHPIGDIVLQKVAGRLRRAVRHGDLVARTGGDEFAVIAFGVSDAEQARSIARRIVEILSRPFIVAGHVIEIGGSAGVVMAPEHGTDALTLSQNADIALYTAKHEGRDRFCHFENHLTDAIQRQRSLEASLRRACVREDFEVVYQPVIDSQDGRFTGAEALVRWTCPERGEVPPSQFIPMAEELGLVSRIGAQVLRQACVDAASWPDEIGVAVNISPVQLLDPRLPQTVVQALEDSGLSSSRLELEITETALLGNDEIALRTLLQLRDLGVSISLDDFGTGYSSLSYLHRFPISRIKIDRSFVQRLPHDLGSASIVRAIAHLGESLEMKITAEGIETDEQLAFIVRHGCNQVQGFLISRPIPRLEIADLFRSASREVA